MGKGRDHGRCNTCRPKRRPLDLYTCSKPRKQSILHPIQDVPMFNDLEILRLSVEELLRIFCAAHGVLPHLLLDHLLADLVGSCETSAGVQADKEAVDGLPLLLPKMKLYTGCSPNSVRKYQLRLLTHRTSRSLVPTPDCSICLNCGVSGKGSFTVVLSAPCPLLHVVHVR